MNLKSFWERQGKKLGTRIYNAITLKWIHVEANNVPCPIPLTWVEKQKELEKC